MCLGIYISMLAFKNWTYPHFAPEQLNISKFCHSKNEYHYFARATKSEHVKFWGKMRVTVHLIAHVLSFILMYGTCMVTGHGKRTDENTFVTYPKTSVISESCFFLCWFARLYVKLTCSLFAARAKMPYSLFEWQNLDMFICSGAKWGYVHFLNASDDMYIKYSSCWFIFLQNNC